MASLYLAALRCLRQHPRATDGQVAEALDIHKSGRDVIRPARVTVVGEQ
jgi:hypothetical protein